MFFIGENGSRIIKCIVALNLFLRKQVNQSKVNGWRHQGSSIPQSTCKGIKKISIVLFFDWISDGLWPLLIPPAAEYYKWLTISLTLTRNVSFRFGVMYILEHLTQIHLCSLLLAIRPLILSCDLHRSASRHHASLDLALVFQVVDWFSPFELTIHDFDVESWLQDSVKIPH